MASSSTKSRASSPFRFYKSSSSQGNIPSLTQVLEPMAASSSSQFMGFNFGSKNHSFMGRSFTPSRGRAPSPASQKSKFSSPSSGSSCSSITPALDNRVDYPKAKECVAVTIRFRPLSPREIQKGDEVAWYADGDMTVRSEYNQQTAYGFDRVFGPATTTRGVYDAAARQVVRGAMEGVNGTVFAYGVTSSGKTHTMHGDQKSPGIIPLAVKDVFSIIQDTPDREFLLRVSYLEIYNEVINDLLDPAGQNLRIREDSQGTYVEGIKEEVVLSPAHALSLIAAGEEHRHVGSNNFNLLSSRSHTIFTLTIESSSRSADMDDEEVTLSQLNLIDLAGSESSKTETTGLRRKEGSYINKSLLTLGTVIAKLSDGKASHVPFRDSKLTRLLQSSLSGHGRVSLICTITPASSNIEETHNTLKFAHRAKRVEIHAAPNRIMDEKSLIKKYQKEITSLKEELDQLKRGIVDKPYPVGAGGQDDLLNLRQQLEAGQVKMQSRLEEEEQAKAALMGRIQRLTKLILVSTKNSIPTPLPEPQPGHRRRHSFGEDERNENLQAENSQNGSPVSIASTAVQSDSTSESKGGRRMSFISRTDDFTPVIGSFPQPTQAGELFSATVHGRRPPPTGETMADQMDLLREQVKMLAGEVAFRTSSLKRMLEQAAGKPDDAKSQVQMQKIKDEIQEKKRQIWVLEKRILGTGEAALNNASPFEMSQTVSKLMGQLNEKAFELEIKTADNRILQEQLQATISKNCELQDSINSLRQQLTSALEKNSDNHKKVKSYPASCRGSSFRENAEGNEGWLSSSGLSGELRYVEGTVESDGSESGSCSPQGSSKNFVVDPGLQSQVLTQAAEIDKLKQENIELMEEKGGLQIHSQKLAEEASYAKELASAAAVELKNLAEEVTKLSFQNAKLTNDLAAAHELAFAKPGKPATDLQRELHARTEREAGLEAALADKENMEAQLQRKLEEAKQKEAELENDLAGMWVLVAKLNKDRESSNVLTRTDSLNGFEDEPRSNGNGQFRVAAEEDLDIDGNGIKVKELEEGTMAFEELKAGLESERRRTAELEILISQLKSEELDGLDLAALEDLQNLHVEALTKLCQAKARMQQRLERERERGTIISVDSHDEERNGHICKVCFEAPTAAVLLPCRHFCLCKPCAVACTECPLCRSGIADRIITFTS